MTAINTGSVANDAGTRPSHRDAYPSPHPAASDLRWLAGMLWLIGLLPSMGLGLLLFESWLAPVAAGALGVAMLSAIVVPAAQLAIARATRRARRRAAR